jgi:hypothetical protein
MSESEPCKAVLCVKLKPSGLQASRSAAVRVVDVLLTLRCNLHTISYLETSLYLQDGARGLQLTC